MEVVSGIGKSGTLRMVRVGISFLLWVVLAIVAVSPAIVHAQPANTRQTSGHTANPLDPADAAVLHAHSDTVSGRVVTNSCGTPVSPVLYAPAQDTAVVVEADPTGSCSGSNYPSSLAVLLRRDGAWHISTSTIGTGFRLGPLRDGHPDIVVQAPSQHDCPPHDLVMS